jgi:hypothetical protein
LASFVRRALAAVVALAVALPITGNAQQLRRVSGVVQRAERDGVHPLPNALVVLHRVGKTQAGPLDSARSDASGRYAFQYRVTSDSAVYFVSSMYAGVAYFTAPLANADVNGEPAEVTVFDTTSTGVRVATRSRHMIVFAAEDSRLRRLSEVYWLENTSARTRVAGGLRPSWHSILPVGAAAFRVDGGDVAGDAVKVRDGQVEVMSPIAPGLRQLQISYDIPAKSFPLKILVTDSTSVLEVLVEDPGGAVRGATLMPQPAVTVQQRTFHRYLARDVPLGSTFRVDLARPQGSSRAVYFAIIIGIVGFGTLLGFARLTLNPGRVRVETRPTPRRAEDLAYAIAALDARMEKRTHASAEERAAYAAQREALKAELTSVLAERDDQL